MAKEQNHLHHNLHFEPKNRVGRIVFKVILSIIIVIVCINLFLYGLFSIPYVQKKTVDIVVKKLGEKLKTKIELKSIRIQLFSRLSLGGIYIQDQQGDTLLYAKKIDIRFNPWMLIEKKVGIRKINLNDFYIHVNQKDSVSKFNYQFLIDSFTSDSIKKDTTRHSSVPLIINRLYINNGRLRYDVLSKPIIKNQFDPSHIYLSKLNAHLSLKSLNPNKFNLAADYLSVHENCGFDIKNMRLHFYSDSSKMWVDDGALYTNHSHLLLDKARFNTKNKNYQLVIKDALINPIDLSPLIPNIKNLKNVLTLKTNIVGTLPAINIEDLDLGYGRYSHLKLQAKVSDYTHITKSNLFLSVNRLKLLPADITDFIKLSNPTFESASAFSNLGMLSIRAQLNGYFDDLKFSVNTLTPLGEINIDSRGKLDSTYTFFNFNTKLSIINFNINKLLGGVNSFGHLSANFALNARQSKVQKLNAQLNGEISHFKYGEINLKHIFLNSDYNSSGLRLKLLNESPSFGNIKLDASINQVKDTSVNWNLNVKSLAIDKLYKREDFDNQRLSFHFVGKFTGLDINKTVGGMRIDSIAFASDKFSCGLEPISFDITHIGSSRVIDLNSSIISSRISGHYQFETLVDQLKIFINRFLPKVFQKTKSKKVSKPKTQSDLNFNMIIHPTDDLDNIFELPADIIEPAEINGYFNTARNQLRIEANFPEIDTDDNQFKNLNIKLSNTDSVISLGANTKIFGSNNYNVNVNINAQGDSIKSVLQVKNDTDKIQVDGKLSLLTYLSRDRLNNLVTSLKILPSGVKIQDLNFNFLPASIVYGHNILKINGFTLALNDKKYINVDGVLSDHSSDTLKISFDHAQINPILRLINLSDISANVNGKLLVQGLKNPILYTPDFHLSDIIIDNYHLGSIDAKSYWNSGLGGVRFEANLHQLNTKLIEFDGLYHTLANSLRLHLQIHDLPINWARSLSSSYFNQLSGNISSDIYVSGTTQEPRLKGFLGFRNMLFGLNYTNVSYTASDTIQISPDRIGFDNLILKDPNGHEAKLSATLLHQNFRHFKYQLNMHTSNFMVLNTENRIDSLFYGKLFVSGNVNINGSDKGIDLNMNLKNADKSFLNVTVPQTSQAQDYQCIEYINVPMPKKHRRHKPTKSSIQMPPVKLNIKLDVTPDIALGVVIDPTTGDHLKAKGSGKLSFTYNLQKDNMQIFGNYILSDGGVKVSLQNLSKIEFKIKPDSKIYFIGDPMKTEFDIMAYKTVKADLRTLDQQAFSAYSLGSRTPVNCLLGLRGNIDKMDLNYGIEVPDVSEDVKNTVNSLISTDELKIKQFAYLLVAGRFYSGTDMMATNSGNAMWTSIASSTLSSGLNAIVGNILGDKWEIGTNLDKNDDNTNMSVNVSTKLFDDRLKLSTNLGYQSISDQALSNGNSFIGDFDVEYRLNPYWVLRAYNHTTNYKFYLQAPTMQGVGVEYTKQAASIKLLFSSWHKRLEKMIRLARKRHLLKEQKVPQQK